MKALCFILPALSVLVAGVATADPPKAPVIKVAMAPVAAPRPAAAPQVKLGEAPKVATPKPVAAALHALHEEYHTSRATMLGDKAWGGLGDTSATLKRLEALEKTLDLPLDQRMTPSQRAEILRGGYRRDLLKAGVPHAAYGARLRSDIAIGVGINRSLIMLRGSGVSMPEFIELLNKACQAEGAPMQWTEKKIAQYAPDAYLRYTKGE
jgi:hypothetical protein